MLSVLPWHRPLARDVASGESLTAFGRLLLSFTFERRLSTGLGTLAGQCFFYFYTNTDMLLLTLLRQFNLVLTLAQTIAFFSRQCGMTMRATDALFE